MVFVVFFDGGMVALVVIMLILAGIGALVQLLPTITVIAWIIFALSIVLSIYMTIADDSTDSVSRKIVNLIVQGVMFYLIGVVLKDYFDSLNKALEAGGINGIFDFVAEGVFGGVVLALISSGLGYLGMNLYENETGWSYGARLAAAICATIAVVMLLYG